MKGVFGGLPKAEIDALFEGNHHDVGEVMAKKRIKREVLSERRAQRAAPGSEDA